MLIFDGMSRHPALHRRSANACLSGSHRVSPHRLWGVLLALMSVLVVIPGTASKAEAHPSTSVWVPNLQWEQTGSESYTVTVPGPDVTYQQERTREVTETYTVTVPGPDVLYPVESTSTHCHEFDPLFGVCTSGYHGHTTTTMECCIPGPPVEETRTRTVTETYYTTECCIPGPPVEESRTRPVYGWVDRGYWNNQHDSSEHLPEDPQCPSGTVGTPPNCEPPPIQTPECPEGETGTPPDCEPDTCPTGETGTPPNCVPEAVTDPNDIDEFEEGGDESEREIEDEETYSPDETASGRCGGGFVEEDGVCRALEPHELEDDEGNARVQCIRRDGELHTTTFLALDPPGCPAGSVGADVSISDPFWVEVQNDRCAANNAGTWDQSAQACTGATDDEGNNLQPCFDGESWVMVSAESASEGCGASQCPVPGDLGNFIEGTNGLWDEETQTCGGGSAVESTTGSSDTPGGTIDTELCHDGIYRPAGSCPDPPPSYTPPPTEPRPGTLLYCRSGSTVRLSWSVVTISNPATGYALAGWQVEWGVQGSAATSTESLSAGDRSHERTLSTSSAWTITLTPTLDSGSAGVNTATVDIPTGDPASGQCPVLPLPTPTVTACRSTTGIEVEWTVPPGAFRTGAGWIMDVNVWLGGNSISTFLTAFSATTSNLIPWDDRSISLAVPVGTGVQINLLAYGSPGFGTSDIDTAEPNPETGCTAPVPTPAVPSIPPDPAPTLACASTGFAGRFTSWADGAPANWEREASYVAEYLDTSSAWQPLILTVDTTGELIFGGPADIGNTVDVRISVQGRHREQVGGVWSSWSPWSAWSGWHTRTTPTCTPAAPAAPSGLPDPAPTLLCGASQFTGRFSVWSDSAPTNWEREDSYEVEYWNTSSVWTSLTTTMHSSGDLEFAGPSDSGNAVQTRIRGQGRQRQSINGTWSPWSAWGAWSGWHTNSTPTCPTVPPPPTPAVPAALPAPSLTLTCGSTAFEDTFSGWADGAPANWEREHEYEAEYKHSGSNPLATWQTATVTLLPNNEVKISGPNDPGHLIDVRVRVRGQHRERNGGGWSSWSGWGAWSGWNNYTTATCSGTPSTTPAKPPMPTITCASATASTASVTMTVEASSPARQIRYLLTWYKGHAVVATQALQSQIVGPFTTTTHTMTLTVGTDIDGLFDVVSFRVRAQQRTFAGGIWQPWSVLSAESEPPTVDTCVAGVGS